MTTERQLAANRRNALKSTGPRTERGKSFSRINARKHGAWSKLAAFSTEDVAEINQLYHLLCDAFNLPTPAGEELLIDLAFCTWRYRRSQELEVDALTVPGLLSPAREAMSREHWHSRSEYRRVFNLAIQRLGNDANHATVLRTCSKLALFPIHKAKSNSVERTQ